MKKDKKLSLKEKEIFKTAAIKATKLIEKFQYFNTYEEIKKYFRDTKKEPKWYKNLENLLDKIDKYEESTGSTSRIS